MPSTLPGLEKGPAYQPREIVVTADAVIAIPVIVDGTLSIDGRSPTTTHDIRAGWLMGRVTSSGRWTPCKRTRARSPSSGGASSAGGDYTIVPVDDASAFRAGDVISVGSDTGLTIVSVDYSQNLIRVNDPIVFAADEAVVAQDGSQTCRGVLLDFAHLRNEDNTVAVHKSASVLVHGLVRTSMLLGDVASIRLDSAARLGGILFADDFGLV